MWCYYSGAYIVVKGTLDILAAAANESDKAEKYVVFQTNALRTSCFSNIRFYIDLIDTMQKTLI